MYTNTNVGRTQLARKIAKKRVVSAFSVLWRREQNAKCYSCSISSPFF